MPAEERAEKPLVPPRSMWLAGFAATVCLVALLALPEGANGKLLLAVLAGAALAWLGAAAWQLRQSTDRAVPLQTAGSEARVLELEAAERRHRELIELSTDYAWEQDEALRFTYFSEGAKRGEIFPELALGKTRFELASEFITPTAEEHRRCLEAREPFRDVKYLRLRPDGSKAYFCTSGNPIFDAEGRFLGYRGVGRSITREVLAELAARQAEAKFRSLVRTAANWYWAQDKHLQFTEIVVACGGEHFDGQEYLGRYRWDMPWEDVPVEIWQTHRATLERRLPFRDLVLPRRQTNGLRYVSISGEPLFDAAGEFAGYHGTARDVTEIISLSEALHFAEDRYRVVAQATVSAIWDHDEARGVTRWTEGIDDIFGYAVAGRELDTQWWLDRVHPEDRTRVMAGYAAVVAARDPSMNAEYRFARADGSYAYVADHGVVLYGEDGRVHRRVGGVIDITAQRQAEFALRESEERFRAMADAAPVMIWLADEAGCFSYTNSAFADFVRGVDRETAVDSWAKLVLPQDRLALERTLAEARGVGQAFRLECRVRRSDAAVRWLLLAGTPRNDEDGECRGFVGSGVDITDRRHAESLLNLQSRTFERIATGSDLDFTLFSLVQAIESEMETGWCSLCRVDESGRRLRLSAAPSLPPDFLRQCEGMAVAEASASCGTAAFRREPVVVSDIALDALWADWRAAALENGLRAATSVPILGRRGEVLGTLAVYYPAPMRPATWDVQLLSAGSALASLALERAQDEAAVKAAQVSLEERVKERTAQLEAANKELEAFSYSVSHDLRAPLRTIDGFTQIVSQRYREKLDGEAQAYFDRVRAGCRRMSELIDDLLRLSMVTRGGVSRQDVDLSELARLVVDALQQAQPQRRVVVNIAAGLYVRGDPKLLRVLLENLLGNAWKFTARKPLAEIGFGALVQDGEVVYRVSDNGAGFDMKYADRLFAPFERLHHRDQFEGSGIGLATVQRVVRMHGGRIWAESAPEQGTQMFFTLG
ncbi:Phytochrome-like protein cph1 [Burkholderiales bacterium]|nr:MAG: PAS domain S-box protein [Burkholderiales bacterium]CAG0948577.1 Phytochrome-like protein cph1 [Burkholderiales bacterium]